MCVNITESNFLTLANDETLRCQELAKYEIAFDSSEEKFNRIALLASQLTNTPISGISIVDSQYIWLKARVGVDSCRLEREGAFCAHAVDSNLDFFMVEDAANDPRFANNPLVTEGIRFYAASPLINNHGYCLGTMWIMDTKPRKLGDKDIILLQGFAAQVVELLDGRYSNSLTGYPNLATFKKRLQTVINYKTGNLYHSDGPLEVAITPENLKENCAVGFLKLRSLYRINWLHGREATDQLVKSFSTVLLQWIGNGNFSAQISFGKFAFAIFIGSTEELNEKLDELKLYLSNPLPVNQVNIDISATVGIALFPEHGVNVTALLEQAENIAMNNSDRNFSSVRMYQFSDIENVKILTDLNRSIESDTSKFDIVPWFQPQINYFTGELIGFEALARWEHKELGFIPTHRFVTIAEKSGLIFKLDMKIFWEVCRAMRSWIDLGLKIVPISSNFSRKTLLNPTVVSEIKKILNEFNLPKGSIEIEISEDGFLEDTDAVTLIAKELRSLGLKISIDDFGTGLSNLSALRSFEFDRLKIDRQFVHNISLSPQTKSIFDLIKGVSDVFNVELLCEGVENLADLEILRQSGASCIQGWLFSAAMPKDSIPDILKRFDLSPDKRKELIDNPVMITQLLRV